MRFENEVKLKHFDCVKEKIYKQKQINGFHSTGCTSVRILCQESKRQVVHEQKYLDHYKHIISIVYIKMSQFQVIKVNKFVAKVVPSDI